MDKKLESSVSRFVAERWISWVIELAVLSVIAFFTISEVRKTNEQTREMLTRYDAAIAKYASEKSQLLDETVASGFAAAKEKAQSVSIQDLKNLRDSLKEDSEDDGE